MLARELLGWNLRRLRVERGLSQERLALAARIDRAYAGRIERGKENVTISVLEALATTLNVAVAELFTLPGSVGLHAQRRHPSIGARSTTKSDRRRALNARPLIGCAGASAQEVAQRVCIDVRTRTIP